MSDVCLHSVEFLVEFLNVGKSSQVNALEISSDLFILDKKFNNI